MRTFLCLCTLAMASVLLSAASRNHVISFGKWQVVKASDGGNTESTDLRVRALLVDGRMKEYTVGQPHDVTDRVFVVATAFRLNDQLPDEKVSRWIWRHGGWVQVDRSSGRISPLKLSNFDPQRSLVSWYRDYVAYCGVSEDATRIYAVVMQLGVRKPILRKELDASDTSANADSLCRSPMWQRKPVRVNFSLANGPNLTFTIQGRSLEITAADEEDTTE